MTPPHDTERTTVPPNHPADRDATSGPRIEAAAFWTGVVLPVVYVPLLALEPLTATRALLVVALLVLNVIALVVGYPYGRNRAGARRGERATEE